MATEDNEKAAEFASQQTLEDIKAYSALLEHCDVLLPHETHETPAATAAAKRARHSIRRLQSKINILTRDQENLSVFYKDPKAKKGGQVVIVNSQNTSHAKKTHSDEWQARRSPIEVSIQAIGIPSDASHSKTSVGLLDFLFRRCGELSTGSHRNPFHIPFVEHLVIVRDLLLQCHSARTRSNLDLARYTFDTYVVASSHSLMYRRLQIGQSSRGRDFYDMMTVEATLPQFDAQDIANLDVFKRDPTQRQDLEFRMFAARFDRPDWMARSAVNPVYQIKSRRMIHVMLTTYLQALDKAFGALRGSVGLCTGTQKDATEIKACVEATRDRMVDLTRFMMLFEAILVEHFKWLDKFRTKLANTEPPVPATSAKQSGSPAATPGDSNEHHADVDSGDDINSNTMTEAQDLDLVTKREGWAQGAIKYLRLICLHTYSICQAINWHPRGQSARAKREIRLLKESTFTFVDIRQHASGQTRKSFAECVREWCKQSPFRSEERLTKILTRQRSADNSVEDNDILTSTGFSGIYHAASVLAILEALVKSPQFSDLTEARLEQHGIKATRSDLVRLFKRPFATDKKGICRACWTVCRNLTCSKDLTHRRSTNFFAPTRAIVLPPFTPKEVAETCLKSITSKLDDKLESLECIASVIYNDSTPRQQIVDVDEGPPDRPAIAMGMGPKLRPYSPPLVIPKVPRHPDHKPRRLVEISATHPAMLDVSPACTSEPSLKRHREDHTEEKDRVSVEKQSGHDDGGLDVDDRPFCGGWSDGIAPNEPLPTILNPGVEVDTGVVPWDDLLKE
ncbi:unnamed protein product [Zymoseptoria tritici ST99CH_1E4]|uniref:Uncharacterized protein n=1 Tax=Zymoseptoria tritici ST99CH_1E4 TaxID=1276532 RepID=A0A2H1H0K0_ZYMTR|nr:unnamed protein product [Zymoseptoria tritici ST99CH_1E4]